MGGAETVKEIEKGNPPFYGGKVGYGRQIHGFLYAAAGKDGAAGLTTGIHIGVVTEDGQGMGGDGSGCHMDNPRKKFSCDAVQIWNHQKQSLRCGKGSGQSARRQSSVDGACGSGLRLHLGDGHGLPPDIQLSGACPLVTQLRHGGGGSDGKDGGCLTVSVGYMGSGMITVYGL